MGSFGQYAGSYVLYSGVYGMGVIGGSVVEGKYSLGMHCQWNRSK